MANTLYDENFGGEFGNGTAKILYSSEVLRNIMNYCKNIDLKEISWRELKR